MRRLNESSVAFVHADYPLNSGAEVPASSYCLTRWRAWQSLECCREIDWRNSKVTASDNTASESMTGGASALSGATAMRTMLR